MTTKKTLKVVVLEVRLTVPSNTLPQMLVWAVKRVLSWVLTEDDQRAVALTLHKVRDMEVVLKEVK